MFDICCFKAIKCRRSVDDRLEETERVKYIQPQMQETQAKSIKNTNQHDCTAEERERERRLKQERVRIAVTLNTFLAVT